MRRFLDDGSNAGEFWQHLMIIVHAGLTQQPFHARGQPVAVIHYHSEQAAHDFLNIVGVSEQGIGLFHGPASAGKKTIIQNFISNMPADIPVAVVDGTQLDETGILNAIRIRFGFAAAPETTEESLNELKSFIARHACRIRQPLLVVENFDQLRVSALKFLCHLANLKLDGRFAVRMILVSKKSSYAIISTPTMSALAARLLGEFEIGPMTQSETVRYLYAKLMIGGCSDPERVFPRAVCDELHQISGGWPGILDNLAMRAIERAKSLPIRSEHIDPADVDIAPPALPTPPVVSVVKEDLGQYVQKLYLTLNRETLQEFDVSDSKILIGRSELCDININSRFVSKHHALLVRTDDALHLLDLKSTNGTFINSRRIDTRVLQHDDVISLGNHGIKLVSPGYRARATTKEQDLAETATMKTVSDMRRLKAQTSTESLPGQERKV